MLLLATAILWNLLMFLQIFSGLKTLQSILQYAPKQVCFSQWQWKVFAWYHSRIMHFLQDGLVSLTQVCLNAGMAFELRSVSWRQWIWFIWMPARLSLPPSLSVCFAGQTAARLQPSNHLGFQASTPQLCPHWGLPHHLQLAFNASILIKSL